LLELSGAHHILHVSRIRVKCYKGTVLLIDTSGENNMLQAVGWGEGEQEKNRKRKPLPVSKLELTYWFVNNNVLQLHPPPLG